MVEIRRGTSATIHDLAEDYEVSVKTFRNWLKRANIQKGASHYFQPIILRKIYDTFGAPAHQNKEVA